jgi:hypothetical protein
MAHDSPLREGLGRHTGFNKGPLGVAAAFSTPSVALSSAPCGSPTRRWKHVSEVAGAIQQ